MLIRYMEEESGLEESREDFKETACEKGSRAATHPLGKRSWKWIISTMMATLSFAAEHRLCLM